MLLIEARIHARHPFNCQAWMMLRRNMLTYTGGAVTKNQAEKKINSLLDFMSTCQDNSLLQQFYEITLESQDSMSNERLWFKANLKLCDLWFLSGDHVKLSKALKDLNKVLPATLRCCMLESLHP